METRWLLAADSPAQLLRDINVNTPPSNPSGIVQSGDKIFFTADDGLHGANSGFVGGELFVIEGTSPPRLVKDILPGYYGSAPLDLIDVGGVLFFTADDGEHGRELWRSDGSAAGTQMVADIFPGMTEFASPNSSNIHDLEVVQTQDGSKLFFAATSELGEELWKADTTGASLVRDIYSGMNGSGQPYSSSPSQLTFVAAHPSPDDSDTLVPGTLFFTADNGVNGRELWKTVFQGGSTQTNLLVNLFEDLPGEEPNSSNPNSLVRFQNEIYFSAKDGSFRDGDPDQLDSHGFELWKSDGTVLGTELVADIDSFVSVEGVPNNSSPVNFAVHNGKLYFSAADRSAVAGTDDTATGRELWVTDGEGTGLVSDIRVGSGDSSPTQLVSTNGFLFFKASSSNAVGNELWRTNGTSDGTELVRDIRVGSATPFLFSNAMTKFGSSLIFAANDGEFGPEVWISDGTSDGTRILREIQPGRSSILVPEGFVTIGNRVYFEASDELWITDGTESGTQMIDVPTMATVGSVSEGFAFANGAVFFAADDGIRGTELWKTDGSANGTVLVRDIAPGRSPDFPPGSTLLFPDSGMPQHLTAVGDRVFFAANDPAELWISDGTAPGTVPVKDIFPGGGTEPYDLVGLGDQLFFFADAPGLGTELWVSDGTSDGTHLVKDILQVPNYFAFPSGLTVAGSKLFFQHDDGAGSELWVSDGTEDGTIKIDLAPAPDTSSSPFGFFAVGTQVFFQADDGVHGTELWASDGTVEGTRMVRDIHVVADGIDFTGSRPTPIGVLAGELYFWAADHVVGQALWKTDGTFDGTVMVKDIRTDDVEFFLSEDDLFRDPDKRGAAATIGDKLYFRADDGVHGDQLWMTDGTPEGTQFFIDEEISGQGIGNPRELLAVGDALFFTAELFSAELNDEGFNDSLGRQLFVSNGTPEGTRLHTRIDTPSGESPGLFEFAAFGGDLYFVANDGVHGGEVWTTSSRLKADDPLFEILARDIAYRDSINDGDTISLEGLGYTSPFVFEVDLVIHDLTGFDAYGLIGENFDPILAVRGSSELLDFFANAVPGGVGVSQFDAVRSQVFAWLDEKLSAGQSVSITGHSLGGALTQLIAANYTNSDPDRELDQVVTFNAPGISEATADLFQPDQVTRVRHYVTNGDPVSLAGDKFIAGDWQRANFSDLFILHNHTFPVLTEFVYDGLEIKERPEDVTFETNLGLEWLNDPFYYHTDTDYFLSLAAGAILTNTVDSLRQFNDVPPALLFRSTTEDLRQRIGVAITPLQNAIDTIISTLRLEDVRAEVPDVSINLLNVLTVNATDMSVRYIADPGELRLQGKVELPQLYNVTADFTGDNYIALSPDGFDLRGVISAEDIVLVPNTWELEEVHVGIDTLSDPNQVDVGGTLEIPTGIDVIFGLGFVGSSFNSITLGVADLDKPIGVTGLFLQSIAGTVDHLSEADTAPISFDGDVTATGGPEIDISLPEWAGGDFSGSLLSIVVNGLIDAEHLTAAGTLSLIEGLATANADVELNWTEGFLAANGEFNILDGLIVAEAAFRADSSLNITTTADATFTIPEQIPIVGGRAGLSGTFVLNFTNDSDFGNDFAAAWTSFNLPLIGLRRLGFRVYFDGSFGLIGGQSISQIQALRVASLFAEGPLPEPAADEPEPPVASSDFLVAADTPWTIFTAQWDNASPDTRLVLTTPAGGVLTEDDIAGRTDIAIVTDLNSPTRRVVVVQNPAAGIWNVSVNDDSALTNVMFSAFAEGDVPVVEIVSLTGGHEQSPVTITFNATDPDSDAVVSLFYDTDNDGADGVLIASGIVESDGEQTFVWDPSQIPAGEFFIYAQIDDGANPPVFEFSSTSVDTAAPAPSAIVTTTSLVVGADAGREPLVRVFDVDGNERFSFLAYDAAFRGGVRVATGDVNGDGNADIITGAGAGAGPHVKVFSGVDGSPLQSFFAYGATFQGGVFVAAGDVNSDGRDDIITGAGPHVKVFSGATGAELRSFFAYGATFQGGVRVAAGDVNGDGIADIITGSGAGGSPHVKVFDGNSTSTLRSFFAYPNTFQGGVFVAAGDVNGDGLTDIVTGADSGGGPHVKVFNGQSGSMTQSFFPFAPTFTGGVRVGVGDVDGDRDLDIITGAGAGGGPHVKAFDGSSGDPLRSFFAFPNDVNAGVFVSGVSRPTQRRFNLPSGGGAFEVLEDLGDVVVRRTEGDEMFRAKLDGLRQLHIVGTNSVNDSLRINVANLPLDVRFVGGNGGQDSLEVFGGTFDVATHTLLNRHDGTLRLDGRTLSYTGLEPVDLSGLAISDLVFQLPDTADRAVLEDVGDTDDGVMRFRSLNNTFESTTFRVPSSFLTINAGAGNDTISVASQDELWGSGVELFGMAGNDSLTGGRNDDLLDGGSGNDRLFGGSGNDTFDGGAGFNVLNGGGGNDLVSALITAGRTRLTNTNLYEVRTNSQLTSIEHAELFGNSSPNELDASRFTRGSVTLHGGGGDDTLTGTRFDDRLDGGLGFDIVRQESRQHQTANNTELVGEGTDVLNSIDGLQLSVLGISGVRLNAIDFSGPVTLTGGQGHDTLVGGAADDSIIGGLGHDAISGGNGHDRLDGNAGNDTILGGFGNDIIRLGSGADIGLGDQGDDRISCDSRDTVSGGPGNNTFIGRPREIDEAFVFDFDELLV